MSLTKVSHKIPAHTNPPIYSWEAWVEKLEAI